MNKILEIGCGQGFHCYVLSKNKKNKVTGIDLSKKDVATSRKRYPGIEFKVMNAEKLNFKNKYFDSVYALDVLEHVDDLGRVVKEAGRVLKIDGKFIINIPHFKSEAWLIRLRPSYFKEIHHVRVFKDNELDKILVKNNFSIVTKQKKGFLQHIELFFLFTRKVDSKTQLSIGSWRDNYFTKTVHAVMLFFDPIVVHTPLVYFPIWIITIPIGYLISLLGNNIFPKSFYYEAVLRK